ncbi:Cobalt-zinc-cadmium resistance protein CzcC precursor [Aquisphaera giovannonii]|uniref:Cobalt-zinc-cadmium resistance protein CzcC n=1 Tax=Aquisphaera giovannonii TaxID=406548 RepID=A0A5B9VWA9_9BACT|nr:TolC family protein [Aquisphaera giovannonii]QEH32354.1 Cobalt-zinc-cadmium resistance protein CzcC precursor [Aquisphaera giovannonii]
MDGSPAGKGRGGPGPRLWLMAGLVVGLAGAGVRAQGPTFDVDNPPGIPKGSSMVGSALGSSGTSLFQNTPGSSDIPIGGRAGPSVSRAPVSALMPRTSQPRREGLPEFRVPALPTANIPAYGDLDLPGSEGDLGAGAEVGAAGGLTVGDAIDFLIRENLGLIAMRYEIPMAEADVLTASLRANPVFYADTQLVPYGRYSRANPGGQTQYDVNITHPLDLNRKRQARTVVARAAKQTVEAQFQDAVRQQVDNLYTAYVDVAAAELTRVYSQKQAEGIARLLTLNRELFSKQQIPRDPIDQLTAQLEQAQLQVRESAQAVSRATRTLAQILNVPRAQALSTRIHDRIRDDRPLPQSEEQLIDTAMQSRPDLTAMRMGLHRSQHEVQLAKRERLSDFFLLYQPYTLQDNRPFGLKSPTSWAVGLTAPMPIYNRNQGNIERAKINVTQTQVQLMQLERQVQDEVAEAAREFVLSRDAFLEIEREILPASRRVLDAAWKRYIGGSNTILEFLDARKDYNERVRDYRDALVRHRRAMLDLNTAVGARLLP